jgi:MOSC domain-containing protein YiiM
MADATVLSVNVSPGGIPKRPTAGLPVTVDGFEGDGHDHEKHITPMQAVCIIDVEDLDDLREEGFEVGPGATGENLTVHGLEVDDLDVGDRLTLSGGVCLELTKKRKPCYVLDAIDPTLKTAIVDRCGFYAKVLTEGRVTPGETIRVRRPGG